MGDVHRWKDNITMDLRVVGYEGVEWIHLAQDGFKWWSFVNMIMNLHVP
jgi:hypothetical protein